MKSQHIERFDYEPVLKARTSRRSKAAFNDGVVIELDTIIDRSTEQSTIPPTAFPHFFLGTLAPDLDTYLRMMDLGFDDEMEERPVNRKADEFRALTMRKHSRLASVSANDEVLPAPIELPPDPVPVPQPVADSLYQPWSEEVEQNITNFEYLLELEKEEEGWSQRVDKPFAKIAIKIGSQFNSELPVVRAWFDMEMDAGPADLLKVLYDVELRKKWDQASVIEYEEFSKPASDVVLYYMSNKAPWPFSDRDFVERRLVRRKKTGDIEVFYRTFPHPDYPVRNKIERGETLIGGQILRGVEGPSGRSLHVTILNQADMKGKIPAKALTETLPASLEKWYRSVKKVLTTFKETGTV